MKNDNTTIHAPVTDDQLEALCERMTSLTSSYYEHNGYDWATFGERETKRFTKGRKYAKLQNGTSVCGFVELATGNIFYPKGWKGPQLNMVRGNVHDEHAGMKWMNWSGVMTTR